MTQARPSILEEYVAWIRAEGWRQGDPAAPPAEAPPGGDDVREGHRRLTLLEPGVRVSA